MRYITLPMCVTLPCSCVVRNTRCTPTKRKPEIHLLAKHCKEMYGGPRKTKLTVVFRTVGQTIKATLSERLGAFGSLYKPFIRLSLKGSQSFPFMRDQKYQGTSQILARRIFTSRLNPQLASLSDFVVLDHVPGRDWGGPSFFLHSRDNVHKAGRLQRQKKKGWKLRETQETGGNQADTQSLSVRCEKVDLNTAA